MKKTLMIVLLTLICPLVVQSETRIGAGFVEDGQLMNFGTGDILWSKNVEWNVDIANTGFLHGATFTGPPVYFADIWPSSCIGGMNTYQGVSSICEFSSADNHVFKSPDFIHIGDIESDCYQGILLFKQGGLFGGIQIVDIDEEGTLHYAYWYDDEGYSNFAGQIHYGSGVVEDTNYINFGTGSIFYSVSFYGSTGYLYGFSFSNPMVSFGDVIWPSACDVNYPGYKGIGAIQAISDANRDHRFETVHALKIGDVSSNCWTAGYERILMFEQNGLYGAIEIIDIDEEGRLHYNYWYNDGGCSDFSGFIDPDGEILYGQGSVYAWDDILTEIGKIEYMSNKDSSTGFFIHSNSEPEISFGNIVWPNPCGNPLYGGYGGLYSIWDFTSDNMFEFTSGETVVFADSDSYCYMGILPFKQNGICGAIKPIEFTNPNTLWYKYWVDMSGRCDFSEWEDPFLTTTTTAEITTSVVSTTTTSLVCDLTTSTIRPTTSVIPSTTTTEKVTTTVIPDTTTTVEPITTSTVKPTTTIEPTTTIKERKCVIEIIFGPDSVEAHMARYIRDDVLSKTVEGRQLISMYYQNSPMLIAMIEDDELTKEMLKQEFKQMLNLIVK